MHQNWNHRCQSPENYNVVAKICRYSTLLKSGITSEALMVLVKVVSVQTKALSEFAMAALL